MHTATNSAYMTWNMPGVSKMYVLYIEHADNHPGRAFIAPPDIYKECIAVFNDVKSLDEYTRCRFGMAYSDKMELERVQAYEALRSGNADGMYISDNQYGVDIVPMFTDIKRIPEYAKSDATR